MKVGNLGELSARGKKTKGNAEVLGCVGMVREISCPRRTGHPYRIDWYGVKSSHGGARVYRLPMCRGEIKFYKKKLDKSL